MNEQVLSQAYKRNLRQYLRARNGSGKGMSPNTKNFFKKYPLERYREYNITRKTLFSQFTYYFK